MAVPEQTPFIEYTANGTTTVYPLTFDCDKSEYLIVSLNGEEVPVGSWSLTGGSITFNFAPANGVLITIERNTPFRRTTEYQSYNNSFRPTPVNKDFDLIWWKLQELGYRDQVIWLALVKEIADRIAGDTNLQNQINTIDEWLDNLQQNVNENTSDIAQLVTDLSKEIADRIANDEALKEMFLAMMDEAINEGTINALAITHVDSLEALEAISNVWDGRTVYVKDLGHYEYDYATTSWLKVYQDADNVKDGAETQKQINDKSARAFASIEDLLNYTPRGNGQIAFVKSYYADQNTGGRYFKYDSEKANENDGVVVFNGWVGGITNNTITSEMVGIVGGEDATAKLDVLAAFMNGKSYNLKLNGTISTTKAFVLLNLSNSKIEVDDLYFVPPATTSLSQNRGAITVRNSTNVTVRNSYLHGECVMYSADLEDGQAGIVFIDSTNCKAYNNRVDRFHTWGVFASNCSNTLAFNNTINHITRQSGINIWHGNGVNNIAFGNTITNIGLYGVEFESGTGLNDKGFSKSSIISDCFQGVTLVNLIDNATIVDHEINRCYRGITYSLSVGTRKLKIADNKVNDCRMGMLHGMANVQSSRNTFIYSAQSFYKTSPYSSVDYFDADGYVYVVDSTGKTNATTWTVGDSVQINGVTHTISEVITGVTISPYTFNFVKIKFSVNPINLRVGDFILKPPTIDNVGVHFFSTTYIESQLDVIQGYAIHYKESMTTTGNRRIKSPRIVDGTTVFLFDNSLSNLNCKLYVDEMQITGDAQLVDNTHANSLASFRYLVSNGYVRPNGYYNLNYFKPVTYGSFSLITQGRRTLKAMRFIAVEIEYTGLATSTGNPAILINDQNFELSLGKVATTTPTDGIGLYSSESV